MINLPHDYVVQKNAGKMLDCSHFIFIIIYFIFCYVFDLTLPSRPWVEQCLSVECQVFQCQASGHLSVKHHCSSVKHQVFQC